MLQAAAGETVVLVCDNERHTVVSWATDAALVGLTLRHETPRRERFAQERLSCVEITSGNLRIEKCDIESRYGTGVTVVGPDAVPSFIACTVHDCARQGFHVMDGAKVRFFLFIARSLDSVSAWLLAAFLPSSPCVASALRSHLTLAISSPHTTARFCNATAFTLRT